MSKGDQSLDLSKLSGSINLSSYMDESLSSSSEGSNDESSLSYEQSSISGRKQSNISSRKQSDFGENELSDKLFVIDSMEGIFKLAEKQEEGKSKKVKKNNQKDDLQDALNKLDVSKDRLKVRIPANTVLEVSYGAAFTDRVSEKKRREKKLNKKSRLYQKNANANLLEKNIGVAHDFAYNNAKKLIGKNAVIDNEDFNDLAQFLVSGTMAKNKEIADLMLGGRDENGNACVDSKHARLALVKMANQLISVDLSTIKLDTDRDVAENAAKMEALVNRIAAFERMAVKYDLWSSLDDDMTTAINEKLENLRAVAAYFTVRKEIITNEVYKDHYDDELTMDISKAQTQEQLELAKMLTKSFVIGKSMMKKCGVSAKNINKLRVPTFKNRDASAFFNETLRNYSENSVEYMDEILKDNYKKTDNIAKDVLKDMKKAPAENQENPGDDFVIIDRPVLSEAQAQRLRVEYSKSDTTELTYTKLISDHELVPLMGTTEMKNLVKGVEALDAVLSDTMPELSKTEAFDGACLGITMLYNRLIDGIDKLSVKCRNDHPECLSVLNTIKEQVQKESESFREKTLEYIKVISADPVLSQKKHTWMDACRYNRGVFYDLDKDKNLSYEIQGQGASVVYKIVRKVPVTKENKKGEEVVYFRKKDSVPPEDNDELIDNVVSQFKLDEKLAASVKSALGVLMFNLKVAFKLYDKINKHKRGKTKDASIGKDIFGVLVKMTGSTAKAASKDYEELGKVFKEWADTFAKRCMAHEKRSGISAQIDCGRNLSDRNVATSRFAALLGIQDIICDSRTAMIRVNNQIIEGNIMEGTGGVETSKAKPTPYSEKAIIQLFQLQIFDFICGQTDRHFANFHAIIKNGVIAQIKGLDNDMAFGKIKPEEAMRGYNRICPLSNPALLALPTKFVNRIMAMNRAYIVQTMGDILNKEEIDALMERLDSIKVAIINMTDKHKEAKVIKRRISYTGAMADDEYRAMIALKEVMKTADKKNQQLDVISKFSPKHIAATPLNQMILAKKTKLESGVIKEE